ncbi:MAG: succinate dehydrogenase cytochrome b subunit [Planctomycetes bacterium]|nr:succinate dehydrogenase cytochrome b subunit [Planctomycetota bacterium]MCP4839099.1 succinate dehydrogenase cytochrome b subunit [Planctomycetota bacterium]
MRLLKFYKTAVGKKVVVAITGVVLILFLIAHMGGNLKVFAGPGVIDEYAMHLRTLLEPIFGWGGVLWIMRAVLLVCVLAHIVTVALLIYQNKRARPQKYHRHDLQASTLAARLMKFSGAVILVFIVLHILQFTTGTVQPAPVLFHEEDGHMMADVYLNLYAAFSMWWVSALYIFVMACICIHLYHGGWSFLQTFGADNQDRNKAFRVWAWVLSLGLFIGFSSVPFCFWTGILPPPTISGVEHAPASSTEGH